MLPFWRLEPPFRFAIYSAFAVLFASGAAWLVADQMKDSARLNKAVIKSGATFDHHYLDKNGLREPWHYRLR
jgi:hypothetical protein